MLRTLVHRLTLGHRTPSALRRAAPPTGRRLAGVALAGGALAAVPLAALLTVAAVRALPGAALSFAAGVAGFAAILALPVVLAWAVVAAMVRLTR